MSRGENGCKNVRFKEKVHINVPLETVWEIFKEFRGNSQFREIISIQESYETALYEKYNILIIFLGV